MSKNKDSFKDKTFLLSFSEFKKPKNLAMIGMLVALYLVVYALKIEITPLIELRFGFIVLAIAGFMGGPLMGASVGILGDILGMFLMAGKSGAAFFFGFTLSYALLGFLCGIFFYNGTVSLIRVILAVTAEFIVSITLNTIWLSIMFGTSYAVTLAPRLPKSIVMIAVNGVLLYSFMTTMSVAIKKVMYSTS